MCIEKSYVTNITFLIETKKYLSHNYYRDRKPVHLRQYVTHIKYKKVYKDNSSKLRIVIFFYLS